MVMTTEEFLAAASQLGIQTIPSLEQGAMRAQYVRMGDPDTIGYGRRGSVSGEEACILSCWAAGKRVLEFGTGLGFSTIGLAHEAIEVVTIDPEEWCRTMLKFPANVKPVASFAEVTGTFGMAFIDGRHDTESVAEDIANTLSVLAPYGTLGFHDHSWGSIQTAIKRFPIKVIKSYKTLGGITFYQRAEEVSV